MKKYRVRMGNPMQSEDLYQATQISRHIKEYIKNHIKFPEALCFLEDDAMRIIDNVSPGRERAYLMSLSFGLSDLSSEAMVDILGIVIEMQIIAAYVKDDILDNNYQRNNQPTINKQYNTKVATVYSDLFLNASYLALDNIRQYVDEINYKDFIRKINESYQSISLGQIETICFNYSNSDLVLSLCSLYERLVGIAYGNYCSMLITRNNTLNEQLFLFGKNIGIALQVKNDISDFIIDPTVSGIPAYQDLLQAQPNVVIAYLLEFKEKLSHEELNLLSDLISHKYKKNTLDERDEETLINMLKKSQAISKSLDLYNDLLSNSLKHLSIIKDIDLKNRYIEFIKSLIYE